MQPKLCLENTSKVAGEAESVDTLKYQKLVRSSRENM